MKYIVFLSFLIIGFCSNQPASQLFDLQQYIVNNTTNNPIAVNLCKDKAAYMPDVDNPEHTPTRYVRVNFHYINNKAGTATFDRKLGEAFSKTLLDRANRLLVENQQMHLPEGNTTPILPTRLQYEIAGVEGNPNDNGIYFHTHDSLAYFNKNQKSRDYWLFSSAQYDTFGIRKKEAVNIFVLEHHPDSIASKTYNPKVNGVGTSKWIKIAGPYHHYKDDLRENNNSFENISVSMFAKHLNHELGHSLGLSHTWATNDGCEDTPRNNNCWFKSNSNPKCSPEKVSNNVMDYNAHQNAYSPCQIGKIHYNMSNRKAQQHKVLRRTWCEYDPQKSIYINGDFVWDSQKDLEGDLIIQDGATLTIQCSTAMPPNSEIVVKPKGKLIVDGGLIYNDCGATWKGIRTERRRKHLGQVEFMNEGKVANVPSLLENRQK